MTHTSYPINGVIKERGLFVSDKDVMNIYHRVIELGRDPTFCKAHGISTDGELSVAMLRMIYNVVLDEYVQHASSRQ